MKKYTKVKSEKENRWLATALVRKVTEKPFERKMRTAGQFSKTSLLHGESKIIPSLILSNNDVDVNLKIVA